MATYEAAAEISFKASHSVRALNGKMEDAHEHEWQVTASFRAETLDEDGFVVDFLSVRKALAEVAADLGGKDLNRIVPDDGRGASAERVAAYIARRLRSKLDRKVYCVRVGEAPGCAAAFYPETVPP